jgi:hypothetical protein
MEKSEIRMPKPEALAGGYHSKAKDRNAKRGVRPMG